MRKGKKERKKEAHEEGMFVEISGRQILRIGEMKICLVRVEQGRVRLGFDGPGVVRRKELHDRIQDENRASGT